MDIRKKVGQNLARIRKEKGLSQEDLAFECRLHRTYISGIERGIRNPTIMILDKIAKVLKIEVKDLI
ncbi:MAG: helix-turn-helix domain-containing protein [Alphaproteobacteria bacterium]